MTVLDTVLQMSKSRFWFRRLEISIIWIKLYTFIQFIEIHSFHSLEALHSTLSRLHHRLPKSFNAGAISSLHLLKSICERESILRTIRNNITNSWIRNINYLQIASDNMTDWRMNNLVYQLSRESGVLAWMPRSNTHLLILNITFLIVCLYSYLNNL